VAPAAPQDGSLSRRIRDAVWPRPLYLAAGLHAGNVALALASVRPHGLDQCSRVRTAGRLDRDRLKEFVATVRQMS
jgi:phosphoribosylanthranilate isomerase